MKWTSPARTATYRLGAVVLALVLGLVVTVLAAAAQDLTTTGALRVLRQTYDEAYAKLEDIRGKRAEAAARRQRYGEFLEAQTKLDEAEKKLSESVATPAEEVRD